MSAFGGKADIGGLLLADAQPLKSFFENGSAFMTLQSDADI
jgi:hypothetical protein